MRKPFLLRCLCAALLFTCEVSADTIKMKNGSEVKGILVEDYRDRITFSTDAGELALMKSDIGELYLDSNEDNLLMLARQAKDRKDLSRSYGYYDMAYRLNPNSKEAKDGIVSLQSYLFNKDELEKENSVKRLDMIERYGQISLGSEKPEEAELKEAQEELKRSLGIRLIARKDGRQEIEGVAAKSPASDAGILKGDILVAIWGRLTGYMPLIDIMGMLLDRASLEIKCTIERTLEIDAMPDIGAVLSMEFDGLTVSSVKENSNADSSGLKKGDLITAIDAGSTRYMPLNKAVDLMKNSKSGIVKLAIRRELTIWRRGE